MDTRTHICRLSDRHGGSVSLAKHLYFDRDHPCRAPQVPESYVPTNINSQMSQRINSMYQTISSRGNLTNIINLYDLYKRDRSRKPMEDIVEQMRKDIKIGR